MRDSFIHALLLVTLMVVKTNASACPWEVGDLFEYGTRVCFAGTGRTMGKIRHRAGGWFTVVRDSDLICGRYVGTTPLSHEHTWEFPYADDWARIQNYRPHVVCDKDDVQEWICRLELDKKWVPWWLGVFAIIPVWMCILLWSPCVTPETQAVPTVRRRVLSDERMRTDRPGRCKGSIGRC
jgi:hypothetical protein